MNLAYNIILVVTAIAIAVFDYRYQKIPLWLVILNFSVICMLTSPIFLVGIIVILVLKKMDQPIDIVYLITIGYLIIINNNIYRVISILILLIYIFLSKRDKISLMVPIELVMIFELVVKEVIIR